MQLAGAGFRPHSVNAPAFIVTLGTRHNCLKVAETLRPSNSRGENHGKGVRGYMCSSRLSYHAPTNRPKRKRERSASTCNVNSGFHKLRKHPLTLLNNFFFGLPFNSVWNVRRAAANHMTRFETCCIQERPVTTTIEIRLYGVKACLSHKFVPIYVFLDCPNSSSRQQHQQENRVKCMKRRLRLQTELY